MGNHVADVVLSERRALADDLGRLGSERWSTESLCDGWTVEDVLAHLTQRNVTSPGDMLLGVARAGGLQKLIDQGIREFRGGTPEATLAEFRRTAEVPPRGPGVLQYQLGELVIHAEDIRRPLGIEHRYPAVEVGQILRLRARTGLFRGLRLVAEDAGLALGRGPSVRGTAMALLMVASGRPAHVVELRGAGVSALRGRLRA